MKTYVEIGAKVVFMELPKKGRQPTHDIDMVNDDFLVDLQSIDGILLRTLEGPLVNGLIVATFGFYDNVMTDQYLIDKCREIFERHLKEIER